MDAGIEKALATDADTLVSDGRGFCTLDEVDSLRDLLLELSLEDLEW